MLIREQSQAMNSRSSSGLVELGRIAQFFSQSPIAEAGRDVVGNVYSHGNIKRTAKPYQRMKAQREKNDDGRRFPSLDRVSETKRNRALVGNPGQQVNDQFPIFCIVIVVVGEVPAVRLYETQ